MTGIPDFNNNELRFIESTLRQRYELLPEIQNADMEMSLCPAHYWNSDDTHFVLSITGEFCHCGNASTVAPAAWRYYRGLH